MGKNGYIYEWAEVRTRQVVDMKIPLKCASTPQKYGMATKMLPKKLALAARFSIKQ